MVNTREIASEYRLSRWSQIICERNASGLSIKSYCESIGIRANVYYYWQRKLREAACHEMAPQSTSGGEKALIPNGWAICDASEPSCNNTESPVSIEIGKIRVVVNLGADMKLLGDVCRMLMSLC